MEFNAAYLRAIQHSVGVDSRVDQTIAEAKERVRRGMLTSVNFKAKAKRNGKKQPMCLVPTKTRYKSTFLCLPDDEIYSGDIIECEGEHWIVIETNTTNPVQHIGMAWLCNHLFKFQNWSPTVIERWGVLDSGVYSTTETGNRSVQETDKQFKIYLPYDDDTAKIYVDKRFGVDTRFNSRGEEIMECYVVTGHNRVARSYGNGAHLLVIDVRSDNYSPSKDNIDLLICDYIQGSEPVVSPLSISGNTRVSIGTKRVFTVGSNAVSEVYGWVIDPAAGYTVAPQGTDGKSVFVTVSDDFALIGDTPRLTATGNTGDSGYVDLEVIA